MKNSYFSDDIILMVWRKGKVVLGYDSSKYRQDEAGAWIAFDHYGNTDSDFGWEIDHIYPKSKGGSDRLDNLQPLQHQNNRAKGDSTTGYRPAVTSQGNKNVNYLFNWVK